MFKVRAKKRPFPPVRRSRIVLEPKPQLSDIHIEHVEGNEWLGFSTNDEYLVIRNGDGTTIYKLPDTDTWHTASMEPALSATATSSTRP